MVLGGLLALIIVLLAALKPFKFQRLQTLHTVANCIAWLTAYLGLGLTLADSSSSTYTVAASAIIIALNTMCVLLILSQLWVVLKWPVPSCMRCHTSNTSTAGRMTVCDKVSMAISASP